MLVFLFQVFSFKSQNPGSSTQYHVLASYKLESGTAQDQYQGFQGIPTQHDGIGLDLDNGSLIIECAQWEWHATTPVPNPNQKNPSRISVVLYQHNYLDMEDHGRKDP